MVSLRCKFKDLIFNNPISNASGVFSKEKNELLDMLHSFSGTFITKSCTLNSRTGNELPSYWENSRISINSMGLPNHGYRFYTDFLDHLENPLKLFNKELKNVENLAIICEDINLSKKIDCQHFSSWNYKSLKFLAKKVGYSIYDKPLRLSNSIFKLYMLKNDKKKF